MALLGKKDSAKWKKIINIPFKLNLDTMPQY